MKLLVLSGGSGIRSILNKLLRKAGHVLEWRTELSYHDLDLSSYDMLIIDGTPKEFERRFHLQQLMRDLRHSSAQPPILVFSELNGPEAGEEQGQGSCYSCGIVESGGGVWQFRCRLHELALMEEQALLHEAVKSPALEPITFEYQGGDGSPNRA